MCAGAVSGAGRPDNRGVGRIAVGTGDGLTVFDGRGGSQAHFQGRPVRALAPASWRRLWAVVDGDEIWRSDELGAGWELAAGLAGVREPGLQAGCLADTRANDPEGILAGTSYAHLLRVVGGAAQVVEPFEHAPERDEWYTPWNGPPAVRTISEDAGAVYVNVHVGGVLRSRDGGATWQPTIDIHADVHRVVTGAGRVYAAGAHGLSVSADGGDTWEGSANGLHAPYCRSVAVCGSRLLLSASDGPGDGRAAVYRSALDGLAFERCASGLPEWFEGNIDSLCLDSLPDGGLAAFGSETGEVFSSDDQGATWSVVAQGLKSINCVLVLP